MTALHAQMFSSPLRIEPSGDERRRFARRPAEATMTATYTDWQGRVGLAPVKAVDSSLTGLGITSPVELTLGMTVSLCDTGAPIATRSGVVVRCARDGEIFRVGLAFHRRSAA